MYRAVRSDPLIADTQIVAILTRNVGFFASTTDLILAGVVTLLSAGDRPHSVTYSLPYVPQTSLALWQAKILVVTTLFAYSFFTLTWSLSRQNYYAIVLAATPFTDGAVLDDYGGRTGPLANLAGGHFKKALQAYY